MVCKNCGMANSDMAKVCSECGSVLQKPSPKKQETVQTQPEQPIQQPVVASAPINAGAAAQGFPAMQYAPIHNYGFAYAPPIQTPQYPPYGAFTMPPMQGYELYADMRVPLPVQAPATHAATAVAVPPAQPLQTMPTQTFAMENPPAEMPVNPHPFGEPMQTTGSYPAQPAVPSQVSPYYAVPYQPPFGMPLKDPYGTKATWALVLGILSLALPILTCSLASPLSVVFNKVFPKNKAKATAGLVLGSCGTLVSILGVSALLTSLSGLTNSDEFRYFYDQYNSFIHMVAMHTMRIAMQTVKSIVGRLQQVLGYLFLR